MLTEILADRVSRLLPVTAAEIDAAIDELRVAPIVTGTRGRPGADRASLAGAVLAMQSWVTAHADVLVELEINPLLGAADGAVALDALLVRVR